MKATTMINERRKYPRATLKIAAQVDSYNCEQGTFQELTATINVSPLGLAFPLNYPVTIDDILLIQLDMPRRFRLYDFDKPHYQIYAQVRRIQPITNQAPFVGVAFVSKDPPLMDNHPENDGPAIAQAVSQMEQAYNAPTSALTIEMGQMGGQYPIVHEGRRPIINRPINRNSTINNAGINDVEPSLELESSLEIEAPNDREETRLTLRIGLIIRGVDKDGRPFMEWVQTADVSRHGVCVVVTKQNLAVNSIVEIVAVQGRFAAQGRVCHITHNLDTHTYHIGLRLLGMSNSWLVNQ
jgi:hypothetical protein